MVLLEIYKALEWPLVILQLILAPVLVILVLLQSGKGDDLGAAFSGGGGSSSVLGTGGASKFLVRGTVIFVTLFMLNSIALAKIFKEISSSGVTNSVSEPMVPAEGSETPAAAPEGVKVAPDAEKGKGPTTPENGAKQGEKAPAQPAPAKKQ